TTEQGPIRGVRRHGADEYRGIPYAAAPTGQRRWQLPRAPQRWQGIRDGSSFGPACPQEARYGITERSDSEDCLSLNVSVPADRKPGERLPVFVFIHGGAFVGGSSRLYRLDKLAREGRMVVVTPNYRVGVLGFMAHPALATGGVNGNLGLEDQRFALAWVQRNIAAFGGDPANVTVGGESAGAGSICMHLAATERSHGLFHKAFILSSGCFSRLKTTAEAEQVGLELARSAGCGSARDPARCMRSKPVSTWLRVQGQWSRRNPNDLIAISPSVGDRALPRYPRQAARSGGSMLEVPLMMGGARHELRLYVAYAIQAGQTITAANYSKALALFYGDKAAQVAKRFPPGASPAATLGAVISSYNPDLYINNCAFLNAAAWFRSRMPVFAFEFADNNAPVLGIGIAPPDPGIELGAVHSAALNYFFPKFSNNSRINAADLNPASQQLADAMVTSLAAFARSGRPDASGGATWPPYAGQSTVMLWDAQGPRLYDASRQHQCNFWAQLYPERLSEPAPALTGG
ncbi:MAG: carboxylesterase family protein, partial [Cyanobacteria bacterium K_DeepCast_35m_m2_155]|nr:carboxylesterase family protein [Cyanobacteria bacterium K_DeepCast_35m_m2_155]